MSLFKKVINRYLFENLLKVRKTLDYNGINRVGEEYNLI